MKASSVARYRCPADGSALVIADQAAPDNDIEAGVLVSAGGRRFTIERGVPNLLYPETLSGVAAQTKDEYDRVADGIYDTAVDWQFASFLEDENRARESMVDMLDLRPNACVLEVGCGTGRDSFRIARRLDREGALFMQDLSPLMVLTCVEKMRDAAAVSPFACALEYSASNALWLPFADGFFDAAFHFGGFNQFGDLHRGAAELTRVTKRGGRVLIGDEAVAPWLRGTEFAGIVTANNPLFDSQVPLEALPISARDVTVRWLIGNCFYVIAFTKADGPPPLDLDLPHKGWRGGTMRSRYFGRMEGVTPEAKALAREAAAKAGVSLHEWLDTLVKSSATAEGAR